MNATYLLSPLLAFLLFVLLIPFFRKVAFRFQLTDRPNHRKIHQTSVPLVGGIVVFISSGITLALSQIINKELLDLKNIVIGMFLLLIMGILDDKYDIRASLKLSIQLILSHFVFSHGIRIESLYGIFGINELPFYAQYVLTIIVITGVVNAFNLMDGLDGLAGGLAILSFLIMAVVAFLSKQFYLALILVTYVGSLVGFLLFNLSNERKIFMGDAGSLSIGFLLITSCIKLFQATSTAPHLPALKIGIISVLIVPVFDALRVFRKRIKAGKSPFDADKTHLHHLFLSIGIKHKLAAVIILSIAATITCTGYIVFALTGITISISFMLILFYSVTSLLNFHNKINQWRNHIKKIETEN